MSTQHTLYNRAPGPTGGRFDFDDGGTYCGGWEDGKAHGHGVCTGPKGQGEYSGSWHYGFEVSGVYTWPSGSGYEGQWQNGKRHGLGVEARGRWVYRGEWTQGFKGRYGVRQSLTSGAKYEGTWANGLQDGYGSETYADGGSYQGQWLRGMRHGYGVRTSAEFGLASHYRPKNVRASLTSLRSEHVDPASERDRKIDDFRGGFVLKARSDEPPARRRSLVEKSTNFKKSILQGLRIKKQRSTGDIDKKISGSIRSTGSTMSSASSESGQSGFTQHSAQTESNASFVSQDDVTDANCIERYIGEWKNDKRSGFGICERSDGLRYEGEWYNNKKYGYGVTTFKDGTKEEGKYKNNVLVTSGKKKHLFLLRSVKFRERIESAVSAANRASQIALQKADIAISRTATARGKAENADICAMHAREDSDIARLIAKQYAPEFHQPGTDILKRKIADSRNQPNYRLHDFQQSGEPPPHHRSRTIYPYSQEQNNIGAFQDHTDWSQMDSRTAGPQMSNYQNYQSLRSRGVPNSMDPSNHHPAYQQDHFQGRQPSQRRQKTSLRNGSAMRGDYTEQQAMNDHFDHYTTMDSKRSVTPTPATRGRRGGTRSPRVQSPPPSVTPIPARIAPTYGPDCTPDSGVSESMDNEDMSPNNRPNRRSTLPNLYAENFVLQTTFQNNLLSFAPATDSDGGGSSSVASTANSPADATGSKEAPAAATTTTAEGAATTATAAAAAPELPALGSACPSPHQRTASLYGGGGGGGGGVSRRPAVVMVRSDAGKPPKRKKSLPNIEALVGKAKLMSREEVSMLSSQRREEIRRQEEERERLRANPLLYLFSPDVKDWFSRQQLVMLVLFINISLAIMFFKLLT